MVAPDYDTWLRETVEIAASALGKALPLRQSTQEMATAIIRALTEAGRFPNALLYTVEGEDEAGPWVTGNVMPLDAAQETAKRLSGHIVEMPVIGKF